MTPATPRFFSAEVSGHLDVIGGMTGVAPSSVDAAAVTVLGGIIGPQIMVRGPGGAPMPLFLLTAVLVPPVYQSAKLALMLTRDVEVLTQGIFKRLGPNRDANARTCLSYADEEEASLLRVKADATMVADLHRRVAEAKLALSQGLVEHDPGLGGISGTLELAHRGSLFVTLGHNHLLAELAVNKGLLAQFFNLGVHAQLCLKTDPDAVFSVGALAVMQRGAAPLFASLRSDGNDPVPFILIDEPGVFGASAFNQVPDSSAWSGLTARFVQERIYGVPRTLELSKGAAAIVTDFLNNCVEPLAAANPALAAFFAPAVSLLIRSAAVLALTRDIKAAIVDDDVLTTAVAFCRHWIRSHARALAQHLPKPVKPRRKLVVQPDLGVDRNILIDHLRRRVGARWRNIRMNLPKGRRPGHWEARLAELEREGLVSMAAGRTVTVNDPPGSPEN